MIYVFYLISCPSYSFFIQYMESVIFIPGFILLFNLVAPFLHNVVLLPIHSSHKHVCVSLLLYPTHSPAHEGGLHISLTTHKFDLSLLRLWLGLGIGLGLGLGLGLGAATAFAEWTLHTVHKTLPKIMPKIVVAKYGIDI